MNLIEKWLYPFYPRGTHFPPPTLSKQDYKTSFIYCSGRSGENSKNQ